MNTGLYLILILALFSALAFWKQNPMMFLLLFAIAFPVAFAIPDLISSTASTDGVDIVVSMGVLMYGLLCAGWSFKLLGAEKEND